MQVEGGMHRLYCQKMALSTVYMLHIPPAITKHIKICNNIHPFKTLLTDYFLKKAFYSIKEFLSAGHNDVDI